MNSSFRENKLSQVFAAAGQAFSHLSELTVQLHTQHEAIPGSKWTDDEVELLRRAVQQFGNDLEKISETIKTRTMSQVKHAIKRKVYTEAGVPHTNIQQNLKFTTKKRVTSSSALKSPSDNSKVVHTKLMPTPAKRTKLSNSDASSQSDAQNSSVTEIPDSSIITEEVTTDSVLDVENLDDPTSSSLKTLDQFISTQPPIHARTPGGVSESAVSNPPPLPPLDLVSEQT